MIALESRRIWKKKETKVGFSFSGGEGRATRGIIKPAERGQLDREEEKITEFKSSEQLIRCCGSAQRAR
jgi:uncharacterized protein YggL (DUF469 family)